MHAYDLHSGEEAALRLLQQHPGAILLSDDTAARDVARIQGHSVTGTIGIVLRSLTRQQRTKRQVLNLLRAIPRRATLHIQTNFLNTIIAEVRRTSS